MDINVGLVVIISLTIALVMVLLVFISSLNRKINNLDNQRLVSLQQDIKLIDEAVNGIKNSNDFVRDAVTRQFSASGRLITEVTRDLTELKETNKRVLDATTDLRMLQNILQNPKQRGVLGEYFLQNVLENILPSENFRLQYKFQNGEVVDAVVILDKGKLLPVDSKFSLENFNRYVEETSKSRKNELQKLVRLDLKNRIDETAKYVRPNENTMDFAFMFIPSETIYYDLLLNKIGSTEADSRNLVEYAFRDKKVVIVSPTSFAAYLQTVVQGLRSLKIEEKTKEIQKKIFDLNRHIAVHEENMKKLGTSLGTTVGYYNSAHAELKKMDKDIVRIAGTDQIVEDIRIDKPV